MTGNQSLLRRALVVWPRELECSRDVTGCRLYLRAIRILGPISFRGCPRAMNRDLAPRKGISIPKRHLRGAALSKSLSEDVLGKLDIVDG